ncbi:hypothetical protein [Haloglomus litoreum]|uniref:hypothetical protein n=1 Tax=Haloglomus litoreum TaxID=3034026 RepID=UPI0023E8A27F|nr:hypothetical protein [Haloglomus sp. DT116]
MTADSDTRAVRDALLDKLNEAGSRTKDRLVAIVAAAEGVDETAVEREFGKLLVGGHVEGLPGIEGAFILVEDPRD